MRKQSTLLVAATVLISTGIALAQNQSQALEQFDKSDVGIQSTEGDKLPVLTFPEADEPAAGVTASVTESSDQPANFEDRWSAQGRVPYLPLNATVPNAPRSYRKQPDKRRERGSDLSGLRKGPARERQGPMRLGIGARLN